MPSYLQKRRRLWYAVLEIPKGIRPQFGGKARFVQSLGTDSAAVAQRRVKPIVARWQGEIAYARGEPNDDAAFYRRALRNARTDTQRERIMELIHDNAFDIGSVNVPRIGDDPTKDPEAIDFYMRATGARVAIEEHLEEWLAASGAGAKTKEMQRADVRRFAAKFPTLDAVSRREVQRWATSLVTDDGLKPKTVQRILSALRGYWRYLQSIEVASPDVQPFYQLELPRRQNGGKSRRPFEPADVVRLLDAAVASGDDRLADLIRLAMGTGCRIEELCALKVEHVKDDSFRVVEAKTAAGWREVPIHRELAQTMARLVDQSEDGYVLSGLTENKYGDRSNAIGKRFGRLKTAMGFGPEHVFHSIRKTVITILENAGLSENVVADIVGHEKPRITYGLYSGGATLAVKATALAKLAYRKEHTQ